MRITQTFLCCRHHHRRRRKSFTTEDQRNTCVIYPPARRRQCGRFNFQTCTVREGRRVVVVGNENVDGLQHLTDQNIEGEFSSSCPSSKCDDDSKHFSVPNSSRTMRGILLKALYYLLLLCVFTDWRTVLSLEVPWKYQVDLIKSLQLHNSSHGGVRVIPGPDYAIPAILLYGSRRSLKLPQNTYEKTARLLSSSHDFTIMATVRQEELNTGSIVAISSGNTRFLELQSSGRKNEIRLHYTSSSGVSSESRTKNAQNTKIESKRVFIETFPYRLADNRWHKLALTISGNQVELWVNCSRIYSRVLSREIDHVLVNEDSEKETDAAGLFTVLDKPKNYSLWIGQRNFDPHFTFQGALQDVRIVVHSHGNLVQCPQLDTECPTCGQFQQLKESMQKMENFVNELSMKLLESQERIQALEQCECSVSCKFNGTVIRDGATWQESCELCSCVRGEVVCRPLTCPRVYCKNPVTSPGECCPRCLRMCYTQQKRYEHGESFSIPSNPCTVCSCQNGAIKCEQRDRRKICPKLSCPASKQISHDGECCKTCPDCSYGHDCHVNATCVSLNTKYTCICKRGFTGDGKHCTDTDECETRGGLTGNHCQKNTRCVNNAGGYECACLSGYVRKDAWNCIDEDECKAGVYACPDNTVCVNDVGSYHCECASGYRGDGINCEPVCDPPCSPGGRCIAPDTCSCHHGYIGSNCDIDVDECADNIHHCDKNSVCVNMPGWYYCECQDGFRRKVDRTSLIAQCQDVDECAEDSHTCLSPAVCVNTYGGYRCQCSGNQRAASTCSLGCFYEGKERKSGEQWDDPSNSCNQCKCSNGVVDCKHIDCNCKQMRNATEAAKISTCCPKCDRSTQCKHQETPQLFHSGQKWIYQCQLCECLHGEIDCWEMKCPPVHCENPLDLAGFCCPTCPGSSLCNVTSNTTESRTNCMYQGQLYRHGEKLRLEDKCASCKCKVPYCDHLVSNNMAINIHRMETLNVLMTLIVTVVINLSNEHIGQDVLLVLCLTINEICNYICRNMKKMIRNLVKLVKIMASLVSQAINNFMNMSEVNGQPIRVDNNLFVIS